METQSFVTREEFWSLQETLGSITTTQAQHSERIMRLEKRRDDNAQVKNVWGPASPFNVLGSSAQQESGLNPTAEAFRNFDTEPVPGMMSSLTLDNPDDSRRGAASRANSVRFDESANNHYGPSSRQSIDIPTRTGSGLGSHPLSERSLSHRSDGRGSTSGYPHRTNSFGLEQSRLLGSITNSPRVSGNPPPGFFVLGPFPSIIRCWLTDTFSHSSLLYAAVCTGSYASSVGLQILEQLGVSNQIFEEGARRKIKLPIFLTEAKIHQASSRSASPGPQVPTLVAKFLVVETPPQDASIQVIIGSDVLRAHSADILLSQEKLMIFDDDRNQVAVPLVRPENEGVYCSLGTFSSRQRSTDTAPMISPELATPHSPPGIIGRPGRLLTQQTPTSPQTSSASALTSAAPSDIGEGRKAEQNADHNARSSMDLGQNRPNDDNKSLTESEKSFTTTPVAKANAGVWATSWRSSSATTPSDQPPTAKPGSTYSRPSATRNMKVLRPGKSMSSTSRTVSSSASTTNGAENVPPPASGKTSEPERRASQASSAGETKAVPAPATTKANPIGSASAFGWLNSGSSRRTVANGE